MVKKFKRRNPTLSLRPVAIMRNYLAPHKQAAIENAGFSTAARPSFIR